MIGGAFRRGKQLTESQFAPHRRKADVQDETRVNHETASGQGGEKAELEIAPRRAASLRLRASRPLRRIDASDPLHGFRPVVGGASVIVTPRSCLCSPSVPPAPTLQRFLRSRGGGDEGDANVRSAAVAAGRARNDAAPSDKPLKSRLAARRNWILQGTVALVSRSTPRRSVIVRSFPRRCVTRPAQYWKPKIASRSMR